VIVDTSVWIDFLNGHPSRQADALAKAIAEGDAINLPGLVLTEILLGLKNDAQARRVESLLDAFDWVEGPTRDDHIAAAKLYRQCRAKGVTVRSTIDCLIAQLCIRDNLPLLAKDRDFTQMGKVVPLALVAVNTGAV
jgi:predicted nucleic acid-binding protein